MCNFLLLEINPRGKCLDSCMHLCIDFSCSVCPAVDTGGTMRIWGPWIRVTPSPSPSGRASLTLHRGLLWIRPMVRRLYGPRATPSDTVERHDLASDVFVFYVLPSFCHNFPLFQTVIRGHSRCKRRVIKSGGEDLLLQYTTLELQQLVD